MQTPSFTTPPAREGTGYDPVEAAQFRARMARVSGPSAERPVRRRRRGAGEQGGSGFRLGWKSWLAIDVLVVLMVVAGVVAWPPIQACRHQESTVGFYAGDSVNKCIRRGIGDRIALADQRMKMLLRGSGH